MNLLPSGHLPRMLFALLLMLATAARAEQFSAEREIFQRARSAQQRGDFVSARSLARSIADYPLTPWLLHEDLVNRLAELREGEAATFLEHHADTWLGERLRRTWLRELARRGRWQEFLRHYRPQQDATLRCQFLTAQLETEADTAVLDDIEQAWLDSGTHDATCSPAFARLYASGRLDDARLWARVEQAMASGDGAIAREVARQLSAPSLRALFSLWLRIPADATAVLRSPALGATPESPAVALAALRQLAQQDVDRAQVAWQALRARTPPDAAMQGAAARTLALAAAGSGHPARLDLLDAVPPPAVDADVQRYQLREAIAAQAWPQLVRWTALPCHIPGEILRWRYWRSHALAAAGATAEADAILRELASERDYYGFLAADKLGQAYRFNDMPIRPTGAALDAMQRRGGLVRMREFDRLGMVPQAYGEWAFEIARMGSAELEVAAVVVSGWGRPERAIIALGAAAAYDDLTLRFPVLYKDAVGHFATARKLDLARVYAIIRAESAFNPGARSPAGALGLMQLMPETARLTARRAGVRHAGRNALLDPAHNVELGTLYLAQMLARYGGNFAMAAAAYNAGPGRVRQWQRSACVPTERWIETIPFLETRGYARRALFYAAIYQRRLGLPVMKLANIMPPVPPRDAAAGVCAP